MTVARLRRELTQAEFVYWTRYYALKAQARELELRKAGAWNG